MKLKTNILQNLLSKEMDRKQFLIFIGTTVMAISGISTAMKFLGDEPRVSRVDSAGGFGGGAYGGVTTTTPKF